MGETVNRQQLKRALKGALCPDPWRKKQNHARLKEWFLTKLEGLMAYSLVDKSVFSDRALNAVDLHYVQGRPIEEIAFVSGVPEHFIANEISNVLNYIIAHAPKSILASLSPTAYPNWIIDGCKHCRDNGFKGALYWSEEKMQGQWVGEWACINCSRRYDKELNPIGAGHLPDSAVD